MCVCVLDYQTDESCVVGCDRFPALAPVAVSNNRDRDCYKLKQNSSNLGGSGRGNSGRILEAFPGVVMRYVGTMGELRAICEASRLSRYLKAE
jgi:hypothetical protein